MEGVGAGLGHRAWLLAASTQALYTLLLRQKRAQSHLCSAIRGKVWHVRSDFAARDDDHRHEKMKSCRYSPRLNCWSMKSASLFEWQRHYSYAKVVCFLH